MTAEIHQLHASVPASLHNLEVEQELLGAAMLYGIDRIAALQAKHFYDPLHARIYGAIQSLCSQGRQPNAATLKTFFMVDEGMQAVGGVTYLARLQAKPGSAPHLEAYARHIMELWQRRGIVQACYETISVTADPHADKSFQAVVDDLQHDITKIQNEGPSSRPQRAGEFMGRFIEDARSRAAGEDKLPITGLSSLNERLGGWRRGNQVFLAGRPGMGKTALGLWLAHHAAAKNKGFTVAFFSLEMTASECMTRLACEIASAGETKIAYEDVLNGNIKPYQMDRLEQVMGRIEALNLYIDDQAKRSVPSIMAECRRLAREAEKNGSRLGLVVIDHLRKVADTGDYKNNPNKSEGQKAAMLKDMAKQLDCTVLTLVQLNRGVEGRDDKRPALSDLRDSGEIEEEADAVCMVYREAYYKSREKPPRAASEEADWRAELDEVKHIAEVLVTKNRHGQTGNLKVGCDMATNRFWGLDNRL